MDAKLLRARAHQIAQSLENPKPRTRLLCEQLLERLREGDGASAELVQQELLDEASKARYNYERIEWLQRCIERVVIEGFPEHAVRLLQELNLDEDEPRLAGCIAAAAHRRGRRSYAQEFLNRWQAEYLRSCAEPAKTLDVVYANLASYGGTTLALELIGAEPTQFPRTLEAAAQSLARAGRIQQAYALAQQISIAKYKINALSAVITAARERSMHTIVHEAVLEARQLLPLLEDQCDRSWYVCKLGYVLSWLGEVDAALGLVAETSDDSHRSEVLYGVVCELAKQGDYERARQLAAQIPRPYWRDDAYEEIVSSLAASGEFEEAAGLLKLIRDSSARDSARAEIAYGYARHGRLEDAQAMLNKIRTDYEHDRTRRLIGYALIQQGRYEEAAQWTSYNLLSAVDALIRQGELERAHALLQAHTDSPAYEEGVINLCRAHLKRGERECAQSLLQQVFSENAQSQILSALARDLLRDKAWQAALETALQIPKLNQRDMIIAQVARACARAGDYETAVRAANQILAPARLAETLLWIAAQIESR